MCKLLDWEVSWVTNHPELYETKQHQEHVISCIKKRYFINAVKNLVKQFEKNPITSNKFALFELVESAA